MRIFLAILLIINLVFYSYAEESDEDVCEEYEREMVKITREMIKNGEMPECWNPTWERMFDKDGGDMPVEEYDVFQKCLREDVVKMMGDRAVEPNEECKKVMEGHASSNESSDEFSEESSEES